MTINVATSLKNHRDMSIQTNPPAGEAFVNRLTLENLKLHHYTTGGEILVKFVVARLNEDPTLPGVVIVDDGRVVGSVSRERVFEALGKPFGIEVYSRLTINRFLKEVGGVSLMLGSLTLVDEAVREALARPMGQLYDPIIVLEESGECAILSMEELLQAQCNLLENLVCSVQQLSVQDPLTSVKNRRGFFEQAAAAMTRVRPEIPELSILMIDLDHFKMVNDLYGHFVGDKAIKAVAEECQKHLRQSDLLGRFGGEEFIILLPDTPRDTALQVAERIRQSIERMVLYTNGYQVTVTASIGIAPLTSSQITLDDLLCMADQAMYAAKSAGRNRVVVWDRWVAQKVKSQIKAVSPQQIPSQSGVWDASRVYDETINGWARALELRDKETEGHSQRVTGLTVELARRMNFPEQELVNVRRGAQLHDMGKIAIPDSILLKPGPLSEQEWEQMRKHPVYAFELLSPIVHLQNAIDIPYCHHEHWDGTGYPRGLRGEEIPLAARIFTVVDVWDALNTDRVYRKAWSREESIQYIRSQSGKLFDPQVVDLFLIILSEEDRVS